MTEVGRDEARCRMTILASIAARNVSGGFSECRRAIVATDAAANGLSVIDFNGRREGDDAVAGFANVGRC